MRIIFSNILLAIDDGNFHAKIYFHTALLDLSCSLPKEMNQLFKTYFFRISIDLFFSLCFNIRDNLSDKLLLSILDLTNDVLDNRNKKILVLNKVKNISISYSDSRFLHQNIEAIKFYKIFNNQATHNIHFSEFFNKINILTEDEIIYLKSVNINMWLTRLIETKVCFTLIKIHFYNYTLQKKTTASRKYNFKNGIKKEIEFYIQEPNDIRN
ncbi:hypothetical protein CWI37_0517p0020 [Hamiltosporidium tvaerminnensis]|uniref:Uncharacterized protein n=1 Tax=Hamiltosporidium tvaerminnensis TaxID=1176355 RepID=A0A4Q9L4W9_9MICR|nr:hypothetical protein CWI37_0517p0020 [Hamiltosporidium tvaerminnensis]